MVMAGLLWYDDDARRPLAAKIVEATERYRDRIGFAPTVCQLPPQQLKALTETSTSHRRRTRTPVIELPRKLRLEPDEHLHPNTFLLGMGEEDLAIPNPLLAEDDETPKRTRQTKHHRSAKAPPKKAPASPPQSSVTAEATTPVATQAAKAPATKAPAIKPKVTRTTKPAAADRAIEPVTTARSVKPPVKRAVTAKKKLPTAGAQQATLWDTTPAGTTRAKAVPVPAKKAEKAARIAKPATPDTGKLAKAAKTTGAAKTAKSTKYTTVTNTTKVAKAVKVAVPTRSTASRAAQAAMKPTKKAIRPTKAPVAKAAKPSKPERSAKQAFTRSATGRATEGSVQRTRSLATKPMRTATVVAKKAARATITPAAPAKPKVTRKPVSEKAATVARTTHAASKPATSRRGLAKSA